MSRNAKYLAENQTSILEAARRAEGKPKATWELLTATLPGLPGQMGFNSFKTMLPVFLAMAEGFDTQELHKSRKAHADATQKIHRLEADLDLATQKIHKLEAELERLRGGQADRPGSDTQKIHKAEVPARVEGWAVQLSPDGYYRAHRRIDGRMRSVYIGKEFDPDRAREKVRGRMKDIERRRTVQAFKVEKEDLAAISAKAKKGDG